MTVGFDKATPNYQLLMSLPFNEGVGTITRDVAKPGHQDVDLVGFPAWVSLANGRGVLDFNGATDYLECAAADCADLDFTAEDFSVTCWVNHSPAGGLVPKIVLARYGVDLDGWEIYLETNAGVDYLEFRFHHATLNPNFRDGCFSTGWATGQWDFLGITRHKAAGTSYPQHYRNGIALEMSYEVGGMLDPDPCNRDLVIGTRFTKDMDWYFGRMWDPRVWLGELTPIEIMTLYNMDRHWFN